MAPDLPDTFALDTEADGSAPDAADTSQPDDTSGDIVGGGGEVEPERPWSPDLIAPAGADGYSDGNVAFQLLPAEAGGFTAVWVGGHDRRLELTVGTPSSDRLRFHRPRDPVADLDLIGFLTGRLHHEIRTLFGDSVLTDALVRTAAGLVG